jgi:hypothetical protein
MDTLASRALAETEATVAIAQDCIQAISEEETGEMNND